MASTEGDLTREDADKMRVVDLKEALKERQLPTDGKKAVLLERLAHALESPMETDENGGGGADTVAPPLPEVDGEETQTDTEDEGGQDQGGVVVLPAATPMDVAETVETPAPQTEAGTGGVNGAPACNDVGSGGNMVHENGVEEAKEACAVKGGMDESRPLACGDQKDDAGSGAVEGEEVTAAPKDGMDERRAPACDGREEEGADDDDSGDLALFVASLGGEAGGAGEAESGGNAPGVAVEHGEPGEQNAVEDMAVEPSLETVDAAVSALAAAAPAAAAVDAAPAVATASFSFTPEVLQTAAAPSNSEDTYAYEEEQERLTMLKNLHQPMRKWFNKDATMRQKYGNYPLFWQDLASWPHMKELKKLYLIAVERLENPEAAAANDAAAAAEGAAATAAAADAAAVNTTAADTAAADGTKPAEAGASVAGAAEGERVSSGETKTASAGRDGSPTAPEGAVTEGDDGKKKRKNRWGDARRNRFASKGDDAADAAASSNKRKSRWSSDGLSEAVPPAVAGSKIIPGMPVNLSQEQIQETLVLQMRLQQANEKLATVDQDAITRSQDPERSPSPPPRYDANGVRTNNRNVRMRDGLNRERTKVIEEMMKLNPMFRPPADFVKSKPHRKLYIPSDEYPGYNFIGLIIGPRGNTQKRLERETGCKIAIRGKGSVKEGARRGPTVIDEDDELHVYISGETEDAVTKAATEVGKLLRPLDDEQNEHKQKQLKELALINGTLREEDYCSICGEKGHRQFECPKRAQSRPVTVEVRCALCGDTSHPTRDCLLHKTKQNAGQPGHEASLDKEYMSFMAELGDGDGADGAVPQTGPRPPAASSAGGGAGGSIASVSGSAGKPGPSPSAPLTNHYVWTPPVATPARPPVVSKPPPMPSHQSPLPTAPAPASSATLGYSHSNSNSRPKSMPMGGHRVSPFSRASRGVGAVNGAAPVPPFRPPPPMAPPAPPISPAVSNGGAAVGGGGGGMLPPPPLPPVLPPPQPPKAVGAPAPGTGAYSYAPPPLPPQAVYGQQQQPQHQQQQQQQIGGYGGSARGYSAYPGPPPVAPPVPPPPVSPWGATTQPPLPPTSSGSVGGYVPPPLPPSMPGAPPTWPPTLPSPQEYAPPPLPPSDSSGGNGQFLGGSPPLPPPPLPGQPPLPPG